MKKKTTTETIEEESDEMYQALTDKATSSSMKKKKIMYARILGDEPATTTSRRRGGVNAAAGAVPSPRRVTKQKEAASKSSSPIRRRATASSNAESTKLKKNKEEDRKQGRSSSSPVMVKSTAPTRPRRAAVATKEVVTTAATPTTSPRTTTRRTSAVPPRRVTPPTSSQGNARVRSSAVAAPTTSSPRKPSGMDRHEKAPASPPVQHSVPKTTTKEAAKTTAATASEKQPTRVPNPAPSRVDVQDDQPIHTRVVPGTEVRLTNHQGDWLSTLIPDEVSESAATFRKAGTYTPDEACVVDFSNDFYTMFDNHNDSDSVIWDPHAEVISTFLPNVATNSPCAREDTEARPQTLMAPETRQGTDPDSNVRAPKAREQPLEAPIFRPSHHHEPPPLSTVLVCKVTTAGTAATTSRSASSSSSSTSSTGSTDRSQASSKQEARTGVFDEDGVSDIELEGVEETKQVVPVAPATRVVSPRTPPRTARKVAPVPVPEPREDDDGIQRRLSFSSLQMMLDKHSTARHELVEIESLEEWLDDNNVDDEEGDPGLVMDGREDTYSFIGADYSFGADRSLISLLPM